MKNYLLVVPAILALTGCATSLQDSENSNKVVVAQLCTTTTPDGQTKEITIYPLNLVKGAKNATEKLNSLILPAAPLDMNFVGVTPSNMAIYSGVVGNAVSLRYATISQGKEHMSFKRDFTKYNDQWGKWEISDESDLGMSKTSKIRFKTVTSQIPFDKTPFTKTLPDSCD